MQGFQVASHSLTFPQGNALHATCCTALPIMSSRTTRPTAAVLYRDIFFRIQMHSWQFLSEKAWRCTSGKTGPHLFRGTAVLMPRLPLCSAVYISQELWKGSIKQFRYLICASRALIPVISGAAPHLNVDSQLFS